MGPQGGGYSLAVLPTHIVKAADRRPTSERPVWPSRIVESRLDQAGGVSLLGRFGAGSPRCFAGGAFAPRALRRAREGMRQRSGPCRGARARALFPVVERDEHTFA